MKKLSPVDIPVEKQALVHGGSGLLILIAVHCTIGAVVSSFSLPVEMSALFWLWLICTVIITPVTVIYRGKGLLVLMIPAFLLFLLNYSAIVDGGMWVLNEITTLYAKWLPISIAFPDAKDYIDKPGVFIGALGVVVTFLLSFSICLRRSTFITVLVTAPLLFLTFVITDLQASLVYMFGILAVYLTLLISGSYSPDNFIKRGLVLMPALAISILLMLIAYMFAPHGSYVREDHIATLGNRFRGIASQMGRFGRFWQMAGSGAWGYTWLGRFDGGLWYFNTQVVNIADSGARVFTDQSLLEIIVDEPGTFYLHGFTMNNFDGRVWRTDDETPQIDEIEISWPSIFRNINDLNINSSVLEEQTASEDEIVHRISMLRSERVDILMYSTIREINNEELREQFPDDESFIKYLDELLAQYEERLEEIDRELDALITELFIVKNPYLTQTQRIDLARSMPAFISEFYALNSIYNDPVRVTMDISRTGDLTAGITYTPYYGGIFYGDNDVMNAGSKFYSVRGNVLRMAESVFESHFSVNIDTGDDVLIYDENSDDRIILPGRFNAAIPFPIDTLSALLSNYSEQLQRTGVYTEIDPYTAQGLRRLAIDAGINPNADRAIIADAVARYVMDSGIYTLTPGQIPYTEDFALYFLQESYGGYCIHYATAAVLMLRALDIPARFTSGYVVTVEPWQVGDRVTLTDRNAHAWVEVFYDDIGWLYLETTPSGGNPFIPEPRPHRPDIEDDIIPTPPPGMINDNFNEDNWEDDFGPFYDDDSGPAGTGSGNTDQENTRELPPWVTDVINAFIFITLMMIVLTIRRHAAKKLREKNFKQQNTNKAVICMWRYIVRLGRQEIVAPEEIEELALKARFSQHKITEVEREIMVIYTKRLTFEVCESKEGVGRLWLKYIRALC